MASNNATPFDGLDLSSIPDAPKLKTVYDSVASQKPEEAAKVQALSIQTGQHPAFVAANLPAAQQAADTPHPDLFADIEKNHPAATKFLSDPANMAVAQGDIQNVAQHSQLVENAKREFGFLDAVKVGLQGSVPGLAIRQQLPDAMPEPPSMKLGIGRQIGGLVGDFVPMVIGGVAGGQAGAAAGFAGGGAVAGPPGAVGGLIAGEVLGAGAGTFALPAAMRQALTEHIQKGNLTGVSDFLQRTYDILKESGKQGVVGALTAATGGAAKLAAVGPIATLAAENAAMTVSGDAVEGKLPKPGELAHQFVENAVVLGAMHGANAAGDHVMQRWAESKRVEADQNFYKAMGQTAGASKLMKLMPEAHQDLIRRLTDGSPVSDVHVPVQAWDSHFQTSGFDPRDAAHRMGVGQAYTEAKLTGGDVKVPLDTYIAKLVGTPHYDKLAGDVKFSADGMTLNQLNEQDETQRKEIEQAQAKLQPQIEADIKASAQEGGIYADLHKQLQESGVLKGSKQYEQKLKDAATLSARHYAVEAQLRHMEPQELYDQIKNRISSGEGGGQGGLEQTSGDRSLSGESPSRAGSSSQGLRGGSSAISIDPNIADVKARADDWLGKEAAARGMALDDNFKLQFATHVHDGINGLYKQIMTEVRALPEDKRQEFLNSVDKHPATAAQHLLNAKMDSMREAYPEIIKAVPHERAEADAILQGFKQQQDDILQQRAIETTKTRPFKKWFGKSQVVDEDGKPLVLYHGTTGDFTTFDKAKANPESDFGAGFYFSNTQEDVAHNYAGEGPDLKQKIELRAEQIAQEKDWKYDDKRARNMARKEFSQHGGATIPAYVKMENPFVVGGDKETRLDMEYEYEDNDQEKDVVGEKGPLIDFVEALKSVASEYHDGSTDEFMGKLLENGGDGVTASELYKIANETETFGYYTDENGRLVSKEILRAALEKSGFDGIIDHQVDEKFGSQKRIGQPMEGMNPDTVHYIAFKSEQIKSALGNSGKFDASNPDILKQGTSEALGEYNPQQQLIKFFKSADVTTIPHELAHAWIEDAFQHVKSGAADEDYLKHWDAAKNWLKVGDEQDKLTREQHEKFAEGFEKYMMEGKAPSESLKPIFFRMAQWMIQTYRQVKNTLRGGAVKGIELTDSARGFMDRLLASDDEIRAASDDAGYKPGEFAELIPPDEQKRVRTLQERAHEKAFEQLVREKMEGISEGNREEYAKQRESVTAQHFNEVANEPVFRAYSLFNPEGTEERITQPDIWKEAHGYLNGKLDHENTAKWDSIAEMSGFADAKEMAQKLLLTERAPAFEAALKSKVDESMGAFSALKDPQAIRDAATAAVHNDDSLKLMALEQKILGDMTAKKEIRDEVSKRSAISARESASNAKKNAADILAGKSVKEASAFRPYITAERQAAQRVTKALAEGDNAAAAQAKGEQMMNHALYSEAYKNSKQVTKLMKTVDKYASRGSDLMGMPFGFMQQIDGLLASTGLTDPRPSDISTMVKIAQAMKDKSADTSEIANATGLIVGEDGKWRKERLPEFVQRVNDNYYAIQLPDSMTDPIHRQSFPQGMTMGDFRDLTDTMKTIGSVGRTFEHFLSSFIKGDLKTNAAALRTKIESEIGTPYGNNPQFGELDQTKLQKAVEWIKGRPDGMITSKVNLLTLCEYLDRMDPNGPAKNNIYRPLEHAWNDESEMRATKARELDAIREKHYSDKEMKTFGDTFAKWQIKTEDGVKNVKLTREGALVLLMNRGSESNLDRLTRGFGVNEEQLKALTDGLSKNDHEFAQDVLDYVNKFWPQAKALEMDVNGVEPTKVVSRPIESAHGTYAGGYFPLAYDFEKSAEAYKNEIQRNELYKRATTTSAHTEQGAMKARVESLARPVRLDFSGLYNHLDDVIHDITHRRAVIDVSRFLNQPDARSGIMNAIGQDGYRKIQEDLKSVASSQTEFLMPGEKAVRWFRFATTFATLGYRFAIAPRRLTEDSVNAIREVGFRNISGAVGDMLVNPSTISTTREFVQQNSPLMRDRAINRESDFVQMQKQWKGKDSAVKRFAFLQDTLADQALSYPVWKATYDSALSKYGHDQAKNLADESIVKTFGSGRELDRVGAQRGGELNRMMSMYYSWHSMMFNRAWLQGKIAGLEYNEGNYGKALAIVASTAATTWLIPAAVNSLWSEVLRNNQGGSDEDRKQRVIGHFAEAPFAYFPMGRNIAGAAIPLLLGERNKGYHLSPLEDAAENVITAAGEGGNIGLSKLGLVDEKDHPRFAEDSARAMSVIVGMPQQVATWTFNFVDWLNKEGEANWRDLLTRRTQR